MLNISRKLLFNLLQEFSLLLELVYQREESVTQRSMGLRAHRYPTQDFGPYKDQISRTRYLIFISVKKLVPRSAPFPKIPTSNQIEIIKIFKELFSQWRRWIILFELFFSQVTITFFKIFIYLYYESLPKGSLFISNEMSSMRVLSSLPNTYKGAYWIISNL